MHTVNYKREYLYKIALMLLMHSLGSLQIVITATFSR